MPIDGIFGVTVDVLGKSLDLRARNHGYISANLANAETPGYVPTTLSFEGELKEALNGRGKNRGALTNPRHIPLKGGNGTLDGVRGTVIETPADAPGVDGNKVELENEMGKMVENQIMYNATVQLLGKEFDSIKTAIKGGN